MTPFRRCFAPLAVSAVFAGYSFAQPPAKPDFARDVYPIFEKSCHSCHGPKAQLGNLRLDSQAAAARTFRAGEGAASTLYQRVAGLGDQPRMPMGGRLSEAQIALIKSWIDAGAEWPATVGAAGAGIAKHWAFTAPVKPPLPPGTAAHPIDRFVRSRLVKEGLAPAAEASRATLLRRLSLDLLGLPPAPAEIDAFEKDTAPDAYQRQVDRLLASPHYGERWARFWLDAARYADSDGYEKDKQRSVWFYRDWVIGALNRDVPYNQFIIEQIAGDLLPNATQDQRAATGFLRNSMINEEGGIHPEQFRMEAMFDRMDAIGKGVLGVTIQCAQCHNHKYDPLKQEEYYRMFAFLNNSHEANIAVYTPGQQKQRDDLLAGVRAIEDSLKKRTPGWQQQLAAWNQAVEQAQPRWTVIQPEVDDISTGGQRYLPMEDGSLIAQGYAPTKHTVKLTAKTDQPVRAFRLELLMDPNLPLGGPGRSIKGAAALTEFEVLAAPASAPDKQTKLKIVSATADINPPRTPLEAIFDDRSNRTRVTGPVEYAIDGSNETAWGTDAGPGRRNQPRKAVFTLAEPVSYEGGTILTVLLKQDHGGWNSDDNQNHNLGRFRLSITSAAGAQADPRPADAAGLFSAWRVTVPEWKAENQKIEALWEAHPEPTAQLVLEEREQPRTTHILNRGDYLQPTRPVTPGVPAFLHPLPAGDAAPNRLTFARWLVARESPTTARSIVNRVWQSYFGIGLVETAEDFGRQSALPSHPELLDWLAVEFMDRGWSLKALHRLIATSATYRQSSVVTADLLGRDPYNRLLARGPRFRVDAEAVRDIALAASGLLNAKIGGPSVYPPAPGFLFLPPASYGPKNWHEATGEDRYRRALYTHRYRSVPYPVLQNFDAPNGDMACVRRTRSNTPLQALGTLNEALFLESARALAGRILREAGPADEAKLAFAFRRVLGRRPEPKETAGLLAFLNKQRGRLTQGWLDVWALTGLDQTQAKSLPAGASPVQYAAWTALSRVLLNLDEAITKE
ncbi:MAG TPA: hypothetical protein DEH78_25520 [Solibacterales bacterium]|nr:hypothetical protein [Bryobacterales bacterium]